MIGHVAAGVGKFLYKATGLQDAVACASHPNWGSCLKAVVKIRALVLTVATGGLGAGAEVLADGAAEAGAEVATEAAAEASAEGGADAAAGAGEGGEGGEGVSTELTRPPEQRSSSSWPDSPRCCPWRSAAPSP